MLVPFLRQTHTASDGIFFAGPTARLLSAHVRNGQASLDVRARKATKLQAEYLGYVCRRPVHEATLGRTVLKTYGDASGRRNYSVVRDYHVHVAGFVLKVRGLAYQQQDGGAAVCASTALWSAFQQVARMTGARTPTPICVTKASASPFPPSHGLGFDEMARAIATLGFGADEFARVDNPGVFCAQLLSFLRSQLPVVLFLAGRLNPHTGQVDQLGHAVTVTGYASPQSDVVNLAGQSTRLRGAGADVVYVHDDNLGSHAHYELQVRPVTSTDGSTLDRLVLYRGNANAAAVPWWQPDVWLIGGAIVPRPSKIRLPIEQLYQLLGNIQVMVEAALTTLPASPHMHRQILAALVYDAFYAKGIDVQGELTGEVYALADVIRAQANVSLPRHVAIVEVALLGRILVQFVYDASALMQHQQSPVLLLCPSTARASNLGAVLAGLAKRLGALPLFAALTSKT
jgi:hypothetical protein